MKSLRDLPLPAKLQAVIVSGAFRQLVRFAVAGFGVTLFSAAIYTFAAMALHIVPLAANTISYAFGLMAGYAVHSRWSFAADKGGGEGGMVARFLLASGCAFALNSLWVGIATELLHLSPLAPVPLMIFVTPLMSFLLNRYWVFRVA